MTDTFLTTHQGFHVLEHSRARCTRCPQFRLRSIQNPLQPAIHCCTVREWQARQGTARASLSMMLTDYLAMPLEGH